MVSISQWSLKKKKDKKNEECKRWLDEAHKAKNTKKEKKGPQKI